MISRDTWMPSQLWNHCLLSEYRLQIQHGYDLLALKRCLKTHDVAVEIKVKLTLLSDIPVLGEHDEPEATDVEWPSQWYRWRPTTSSVDLSTFVDTFTESQLRACKWIEGQFNNKQVRLAIVGPLGAGKSFIELANSKGLVSPR